ncbi:MAG: YciI family protein, partial [Gemmatimonadota bacterium]
MRYLILIYENEDTAPQDSGELDRWFAYTEQLKEAGVLRGGEALQSTSTATTVRRVDGKVVTSDGPFAETKEQLGGFYMVECADLDEALKWAA